MIDREGSGADVGASTTAVPANTAPVTKEPAAPAAAADDIPADRRAVAVAVGLILVSLAVAVLLHATTQFKPRSATIDALAGLTIGAFIVDRLLTFLPPWPVRAKPLERTADLRVLRFGYGAVVGAFFVGLTNLQIVDVLTKQDNPIDASVDRALTVLAVAGGVVGLARLLNGINPQPPTEDKSKSAAAAADVAKEQEEAELALLPIDPPSSTAWQVGLAGLAIAAGLGLLALAADHKGVDLIGTTSGDDGTVTLVVRFGLVIAAAAVVEQVAEVLTRGTRKADKPLVTGAIALVLGVAAARIFDLYLLHNLGFFGTGTDLNAGITASTDAANWGDTFLTGVVIAAGTKPLHDLASRLKKATPKPKPKPAGT